MSDRNYKIPIAVAAILMSGVACHTTQEPQPADVHPLAAKDTPIVIADDSSSATGAGVTGKTKPTAGSYQVVFYHADGWTASKQTPTTYVANVKNGAKGWVIGDYSQDSLKDSKKDHHVITNGPGLTVDPANGLFSVDGCTPANTDTVHVITCTSPNPISGTVIPQDHNSGTSDHGPIMNSFYVLLPQ